LAELNLWLRFDGAHGDPSNLTNHAIGNSFPPFFLGLPLAEKRCLDLMVRALGDMSAMLRLASLFTWSPSACGQEILFLNVAGSAYC
jgi:hypothetical protein